MVNVNPSYVWNNLALVILTVDKKANRERVRGLQNQLDFFGLPKAYVWNGEKCPKGVSVKEMHMAVFKEHRRVCQWFDTTKPAEHLWILEDDCCIMDKYFIPKLKSHLKVLQDKKWSVLSLGGPSYLSSLDYVAANLYNCYTILSHCYIFNGKAITKYLNLIPEEKWHYADMVEGWLAIPKDEMFLVHPMLASQSVNARPIEFYFMKDPDELCWAVNFWNNLVRIFPYVIIGILVFALWALLIRK
jgi:hypothetical protein